MLCTIDTPNLAVTCDVAGAEDGPAVFLLHGWPDDALTWGGVRPALHEAGFRTIAPYLRGCGPTRFRDDTIPRNGQLVALAQDVLSLADALALPRFAVVGHDWGARAAYIAAALAPERVAACVALSVGWGTNDPDQSLSLTQTQAYWYQWLMSLDRGAHLVRHDRKRFTRYIWSIWNPGWSVPDEVFEATAASFDNPDWAEVTLHSYRVRWGLAPRAAVYDPLEARIAAYPIIHVPTLVLHGGADPCNTPATSEGKEKLFAGLYRRMVLDGLGHFPQRQHASAVAAAMLPFLLSTVQDGERKKAVLF
jgi:pimeloyl-ACP methyl ester carboxylesterase